MKVLILGGYGNVGIFLSAMILEHTQLTIILAGRNIAKAEKYRKELSRKYDESRIEISAVDASGIEELINSFSQADFVINCASTLEHTDKIIQALIATKKDYFDVLLSSHQKIKLLKKNEDKFVENEQCIITDCGFHPGLPAAMINYAAIQFDELHTANVGSLLNMDWKFELSSPNTIKEFINEFKEYDSSAYVNGKWKELSYNDFRKFDFCEPFGKKACVAMMLEELKELPNKYPHLKETGFYVSGFNWFTDYLVMPIMMITAKKLPAQKLTFIANIFKWSISKFSKPPYKVILQLIAEGINNNERRKMIIEVAHEDGYYLTAAPMFACLQQYLNGKIKKPGLFWQANIVDPTQFFIDLEKLNCSLTIKRS